ncbi:hypothetical protein PV677_36315 [Streptomyces sp. DE06-01C]|uniref:hypothetical protein n=1 Tax=Streptomyces sp. DE06-01C TaxID=3028656 RepID=UPI0029C31B23|nr:hypothetical protein [Streptomyces sp. DE06-01C]MDX5526136.1 hypothetical protein [Streptomyces sp. DE06-01C]
MTRTIQERAAHARWASRRREQKRLGVWKPFVPAAPVREHLEKIREAGMPVRATAVRVGLPYTAFEYLVWGDQNNPPGEMVRTETADLILGYWPTLADFPDGSRIDPTGTRRRVHALETLGFSQKFIADRLGIANSNFARSMVVDRVTARVARGVAAQYDLLWNKRPEDFGVKQWVADRTRRMAARQGWAPPLAWDDDTIDNPAAVPQLDAPMPGFTEGDDVVARFLLGESVVLDRAAQREVIAHLMEWSNETPEEIGARLGMTGTAVGQTWVRMNREAREAGRPVPWRRVYIPRNEINQNDMRSAA